MMQWTPLLESVSSPSWERLALDFSDLRGVQHRHFVEHLHGSE